MSGSSLLRQVKDELTKLGYEPIRPGKGDHEIYKHPSGAIMTLSGDFKKPGVARNFIRRAKRNISTDVQYKLSKMNLRLI